MSQLESFRVLPVDDDISWLESMEAVLADQFVVRCCSSGHEAFNQFASVAHSKRSNAALEAVVLGDRK